MNVIGKPQTLRLLNKDIIETIIRAQGPVSKPELSRQTGLSLVTVNKTVDALVGEGRVLAAGMRDSGGGRSAQTYAINRRQYCFLALLLNDGHIHAALADALGEPLVHQSFAVDVADAERELYRCIDAMCEHTDGVPLMAIGLGVPGVVSGGVVTSIPTVPALEGVPLAETLFARYGCDIAVENDVNLAAWGLYHRCFEAQADHLALVYLERSVGCGLILNRQIYAGATSYAGEIGGFCAGDCASGAENAFESAFLALCEQYRAQGGEALLRRIEALVVQAVQNVTCVVDTGLIAIRCGLLTDERLARVEAALPMQGWHKPRLELVGDLREDCLTGVVHLCVQNTTPAVSIAGWEVM